RCSRNVGLAPDSGPIAALPRTDVQGQKETNGSAAIWLVRQPPNSDFRCGGENVVGDYRSTNALEFKLANCLDGDGVLDRHQHTRADQNLTGLGFVAEPGCDIGHCSNGGIVESPLEADGAQGRISVRYANTKADLVS